MESWQTIVSSISGSVVLTGVLGFLLREWISTRIRKSIEHEYSVKEAKLKAELDGELVGLKAGYQKVLDENQIRFSRLYEDQAEACKTLYRLIHRTHSRVALLVSVLQNAPSDLDEAKAHWDKQEKDALDAFNACNAFFHENRILLPDDVCAEMDEFLSIARKAYRDFTRRERRPEAWDEAHDAMRGPAASLKRKLENRFRQILGLLPTQEEGPARDGEMTEGGKD